MPPVMPPAAILADVETHDLGTAETTVDHQGQHGLVATSRASGEELLDGLPLRDTSDVRAGHYYSSGAMPAAANDACRC
jgi:hypothetical protein